MKKLMIPLFAILFCVLCSLPAAAADTTYTVIPGDSLWRIAVKFQTGLDELIHANPQITTPAQIYPGEVVQIPEKDTAAQQYAAEVIRLVNEIRVQNGLAPLRENWELSRVARFKSQDMADRHYFSHTSPTYGSPFQMMQNFGIRYRAAGENLAYGQRTPQAVVNAWMHSAGHRANILNAAFTQIGVGFVAAGHYWTQMFIG